jgi:ribosomal protein S18 acetylase RimI-like enzyme
LTEFLALPLPDKEIKHLIEMQFEAQERHYREQFPGARFRVVLVGPDRVGRMTVHHDSQKATLIDIAILPDFQSQQIGTQLLGALISQSQRDGLPVRCHVDPYSQARRLYKRLGFVECGQDGHLLSMEYPCVTLPH